MAERRRRSRRTAAADQPVTIAVDRPGEEPIEIDASMVDSSEWGLGLESPRPLVVGVWVRVWSPAILGAEQRDKARRAQVVYCRTAGEGRYRAGCAFEAAPPVQPEKERGEAVEDLYEVLQVNPAADQDTIHRVYRMLAQRYHPDNPETGNQTAFRAVLHAHQTLSDPEKRAAYDVRYQAAQSRRWEIFREPSDAEGMEIQKRMRAGILTALYQLKAKDADSTGITLRELEKLLGCPREHMEFPVWYLRRKELVSTAANGRFEITAAGCDAAEEMQAEGVAPMPARLRELPAAADEEAPTEAGVTSQAL